MQHAHAGRWRVVDGVGVGPDGYDAYVAHANDRDGWPCWRIADAYLDGECGAPSAPELDPTPYTEDERRDLLPLLKARITGTIDAAGLARLRQIEIAHRFERLPDAARGLIDDIARKASGS